MRLRTARSAAPAAAEHEDPRRDRGQRAWPVTVLLSPAQAGYNPTCCPCSRPGPRPDPLPAGTATGAACWPTTRTPTPRPAPKWADARSPTRSPGRSTRSNAARTRVQPTAARPRSPWRGIAARYDPVRRHLPRRRPRRRLAASTLRRAPAAQAGAPGPDPESPGLPSHQEDRNRMLQEQERQGARCNCFVTMANTA